MKEADREADRVVSETACEAEMEAIKKIEIIEGALFNASPTPSDNSESEVAA